MVAGALELDPKVILAIAGGIGAVIGSAIGALAQVAISMLQRSREKSDKRAQTIATTQLLRAKFGQIGRHSATNLRRLTEVYRAPLTGREMVVALKKMSLQSSVNSNATSVQERDNLSRVEDIAGFPEHLARDVLRLEITARNIEIDIAEAISLFREKPNDTFRRDSLSDELSLETGRMESLSKTIERCAQDSAALVVKLKNFEEFELRPSRSKALARKTKWLLKLGLKESKEDRLEFHDEPIHFTDAMSLREVGDWANWKEEQNILSTADIIALLRTALKLQQDQPVEVVSQRFGTFNSIAHCRRGEVDYCVRVRVNETEFQYEPGLVKEVFVANALMEASGRESTSDEILADIYHRCIAALPEYSSVTFPIGPDIYFAAAHSGIQRVPHPCAVTEWSRTTLLSRSSDQNDGFEALGRSIRMLHSVRTSTYYRNLRDLGEYRYSREFSEEIVQEISRRNDDIRFVAKETLEPLLERVATKLSENEIFCLCHNDLHPDNVFWNSKGEKKIVIVDWDNACINHPYLDFVKIRYWSRLDVDGRLIGDDSLFERFCVGYGESAKRVAQSPIFLALSLLWLFRILGFEKRREFNGKIIPKPFQPSHYYKKQIDMCISSLEKMSPSLRS